MPEATATADPPDEPPGLRAGSQGLWVAPHSPSVKGTCPNSGMLVLPMMIAPAARSRATTSESTAAGIVFPRPPRVVTSPATSISSFTATGTPNSGSAFRSRAGVASSSRARDTAPGFSWENAFSSGSRLPMRSSTRSMWSSTVDSPPPSRRPRSAAPTSRRSIPFILARPENRHQRNGSRPWSNNGDRCVVEPRPDKGGTP